MSSAHQWGAGVPGAPLASARSAVILDAAQLLAAKHRKVRGQFLLEGLQGVTEALAEQGVVERLFVTTPAAQAHGELLSQAEACAVPVTVCDDKAMRRLATAVTPTGLVALCRMPRYELTDVMPGATLVIYLHQVNDPGNLGTIIRTADAAGADAVLLSPGSVDPFNDKALRSTAGSITHIPVVREVCITDAIAASRATGMAVIATTAAGTPLTDGVASAQLSEPTLWLFGSEAHGLPLELLSQADAVLSVPHYGQAESLNLSVAAAVCIYASAMARADR